VRFFMDQGITANRLVAAGFGEYQPLDTGDTEAAYRRNRRIELKLTER
jgi:chemotaxis protein MotB